MISEFQELSDKVDRLAELAHSLRRENAVLRQSNALLSRENEAFMERLVEAQRRVEALLATLPAEEPAAPEPAPASAPESMPIVAHVAEGEHAEAVPQTDEAAQ
ncbi:MAG: hypothetical protein ACLGI6_18920 [Gammaproteobacteria bacterium]